MSVKTKTFVLTVERYPCLYNYSLPEYSRKDITEKAWSEVSNETNWTVADCKERWKNIRNGFVRSLKTPRSCLSAKGKKPYYLHDDMKFVIPYLRPIIHSDNADNPTHTDENEENLELFEADDEEEPERDPSEENILNEKRVCGSIEGAKKKMKKEEELEEALLGYLLAKRDSAKGDHRRMFLLSLMPDVTYLSDDNFRKFKIKTMMLAEDLISEQTCAGNQSPRRSRNVSTSSSSLDSPRTRRSPEQRSEGNQSSRHSQNVYSSSSSRDSSVIRVSPEPTNTKTIKRRNK